MTSATSLPPVPRGDSRRRITEAALELFEEQGYPATTVDHITERAGLSRRTFFHHFPSKDAVLFLDHEHLIERVRQRLADGLDEEPVTAVIAAVRLVMRSYLAEPAVSVRRYRLARASADLREREIAWVHRYQLLFSRYLSGRYADRDQGELLGETLAAALVALHNHVLRDWLAGGGTSDAEAAFDEAIAWFRSASVPEATPSRRVVVAAFDHDVDPEHLARVISDARTDRS
jgi:AcrR family transcriptional regulator